MQLTDSRKKIVFGFILLFLVTLVVYIPAMKSGFIWDDDDYVQKNLTLRTLDGLKRIWIDFGSVPQYYPLVHTSFWVEYHLWGLNPFGYHVVNILLHAVNALLLWLILCRLKVPGAWLAAALFALHPVQVESVAWITERKNVLSAFCYMCAMLAYMRFSGLDRDIAENPIKNANTEPRILENPSWGIYLLALFFYLCALLSKTVACSLPAALVLTIWWKRDRITKQDLLALAPFFILGAAFASATGWLEKNFVGAMGEEWSLSILERILVAGRALWFYAGKLIWPTNLAFIYPRWEIDAGTWWQYLFPIGAVLIIVALWALRRRIGKGPLVAVLFFAGTLTPALGFFNLYPHRYSFVADHFQYLASLGLIVSASALVAIGLQRLKPSIRPVGHGSCASLIVLLAVLTWNQTRIYRDLETLWQDTLAKNPLCWMAYNNLGILSEQKGRLDEAADRYVMALEIRPGLEDVHTNLANVLQRQGKTAEAFDHYQKALRINPNYWNAHINLGTLLLTQGNVKGAIRHYARAVRIYPNFAIGHYNLGIAYSREGNKELAIRHYAHAVRLNPYDADARDRLGMELIMTGKIDAAIHQFREALGIRPGHVSAKANLENALSLRDLKH